MRNGYATRTTIALGLFLAACASSNTSVVDSWKDPTVPVRNYRKILAVFMTSDTNTRRSAEDALARKIGGAVASYTVVPDSILRDARRAKEWVKRDGFDAAVLMRPFPVGKEMNYVARTGGYTVPAGYRSTWEYWDAGWGYAYNAAHYAPDEVVYIETNVYSLTDDKLAW